MDSTGRPSETPACTLPFVLDQRGGSLLADSKSSEATQPWWSCEGNGGEEAERVSRPALHHDRLA